MNIQKTFLHLFQPLNSNFGNGDACERFFCEPWKMTKLLLLSSDVSGTYLNTRNLVFGFWKTCGADMSFLGKLSNGFLFIFLQNILAYLPIWFFFKEVELQNCEQSSNKSKICKKWRKTFFNMPWTHFPADFGSPKIKFRVLDLSLDRKKLLLEKWFYYFLHRPWSSSAYNFWNY